MKLPLQIFLSVFLSAPLICGITIFFSGIDKNPELIEVILSTYQAAFFEWIFVIPLYLYSVLYTALSYRLSERYKENIGILFLTNVLVSIAMRVIASLFSMIFLSIFVVFIFIFIFPGLVVHGISTSFLSIIYNRSNHSEAS